MATKNINHSKIKNSGLLFELLVRQITVDTLENKSDSPAVSIMKKYYRPTTELGKELQMYRAFFEMKKLTEMKASQFVDFIAGQRKKLDEKKLMRQKYDLIKEIKNNYDLLSFLKMKIPAYKEYAAIYKTFLAETRDFDISNLQEVASSRFTLIEHLVKDKKSTNPASEETILETFKNQQEDLRLLSYKLMLDRFNARYQNLTENQKELLREYINSVSDSNKFTTYVRTKLIPLQEQVSSLAKKEKDQILQIKLNEVVNQLENVKEKKHIKDNELTAIMVAYQLVDELKS